MYAYAYSHQKNTLLSDVNFHHFYFFLTICFFLFGISICALHISYDARNKSQNLSCYFSVIYYVRNKYGEWVLSLLTVVFVDISLLHILFYKLAFKLLR